MHFVVTANSPGEVATWLTPTVKALKGQFPLATISVYIVPCAFASGAETDVVKRLDEVDRAYSPRQYWRVALGGRPPAIDAGVLLYLGGDLVHAAHLARRLNLPAVAYVERGSRWTSSFRRLLVPDEKAKERVLKRGERAERVHVIGDLMIDAVKPTFKREEALRRFGLDGDKPIVAVFPGSRPYEIAYSLPFLLRGMELAAEAEKDLQCTISLSSFARPQVLAGKRASGLDGTSLQVKETSTGWQVVTERGLRAYVVQGLPYDVMQVADLAVTLPGSNTAEMAAAGLPMVVTLPLNLAEKIPLPGAIHYVEKIPFIGKKLKRAAVHKKAAQMQFVAWPNRKAGRFVVPEVRGVLHASDVAKAVVDLLSDEHARLQMAQQLQKVMGPAGAAAKLTGHLADVAGVPVGKDGVVR